MKIQALLTEKGKMNKWGDISTETCVMEMEITEEQRKQLKQCILEGRDYCLEVPPIPFSNHINPIKLTEKSLSEL